LPVAFTTLFAYAGSAAPALWLLVARTGGFVALVLAFRVARRLGGTLSGWLAAGALVLATDFLFNALRGDSEGLLVALTFAAIELHLRGHRRWAFAVGLLAGLLRPEVWLLLAAYAIVLVRRDRRALVLAVAGGAALLAAWFVPDYVSTGDWLRGAGRARHPVPGSPGQSSFPFGLTFAYASVAVSWPVFAGAVYAVARARREPRDRVVPAIGAAAAVLTVTVALLAEAGFTGNIRYVTLPAALVCLLGGLGLPGLVRALSDRWRRVAAVPAAIAVAVSVGIVAWGGVRLAREERALGSRLDHVIAAAGGPAAIKRCGQVSVTKFERQALAYRLHLPSADVWTHSVTPGIAFIRNHNRLPGAAALPVRVQLPSWTLRSAC
jgi:TRAP-type C4-dicarboxylate transport system permease small subunit